MSGGGVITRGVPKMVDQIDFISFTQREKNMFISTGVAFIYGQCRGALYMTSDRANIHGDCTVSNHYCIWGSPF